MKGQLNIAIICAIARICSKHFSPNAMKEKPLIQIKAGYSPSKSKKLKADAVPTKYLTPRKVSI